MGHWLILAACLVAAVSAQGEEPLIRCPRLLCDIACVTGYKTDASGCPVCDCLPDPCVRGSCGLEYECHYGSCEHHPCTSIPPVCEPCEGRDSCGACSEDEVIICQDARKGDECKCVQVTCEMLNCPEGTVCDIYNHSCKARSLCHEMRDMWQQMQDQGMGPMMGTGPMMMGRHHMMMGSGPMMMGPFMGRGPNMHMMPLMSLPQPPSCEDHSGDFVPTQCHGTECFCVDDRGMEVPGTRSQESDLLDCAHNRTVGLHMQMMMRHNMDDIEEHLDELRNAMLEHLSRWMLMDQNRININEVLPPPADAEGGFVLVRVAVSGGDGDLPSAAHLLLRQVHQGQLQVSFHNQPLTPDPQSLEIQHEFVQPPVLPDEHGPEPTPEIIACFFPEFRSFAQRHRLPILICAVGLLALLALLMGIALRVIKKRRSNLKQFKHRRFDQMDTLQKNIILSNEMDLESENKAAPESDLPPPPYEEKVIVA